MRNKVKISVIIVHYKNESDLISCLNSLYSINIKVPFEVIIVDNSENQKIKSSLTKFRHLKYIYSKKNVGYGAGINIGVRQAKGDYIFVLNPDTVFKENIIDRLYSKIKISKKIGIVAPLLVSTNGKILDQGARELTPLRAIFKLSFIDKIWKNNPLSKEYWVNKWGNKLKRVDNVPGSAFLIRKQLFEELGGFDERFFLYFEEFDLCKRVRGLGYKIYIDPQLKLIHKWGTSTKLLANKDQIFQKSRFYYFRKHFGLLKASIVELFLNINPNNLILFSIVIAAVSLRLYKIDEFIPFYGDIGWFYVSARDMLISGNIPLVGITSSHLWLHQGPIWTYILSFIFYIYDFNPTAPYYFTAILDVFTLILIYKLVKYSFSSNAALIASVLYAFSPAVILSARVAYHTSPIPFFIALFIYCIFKWLNGKIFYFPLIILSLSMLYNFELQTVVLLAVFISLILFGFLKKKSWFLDLFNFRILILSLIAAIVPMLPIIIYDFKNGFSQTIVFFGWLVYKLTGAIHPSSFNSINIINDYLISSFQKMIFLQNGLLASILLISSASYFVVKSVKEKNKLNCYLLILFIFTVTLGSIIVNKTPSDAYLMSIFIPVIIMMSVFISSFIKNKYSFYLILSIVIFTGIVNINMLIKNNYFVGFSGGFGPTFKDRLNVAKYIVENSKDEQFTILGKGPGSEFENFTMNYKYLTWYFGKESTRNASKRIYILEENGFEIKITKKE